MGLNRARRLDRLEESATGPGTDDLCPTCGGLNITTLMLEVDALEKAGAPLGEVTDQGHVDRLTAARCRRCGEPTLLALLAARLPE